MGTLEAGAASCSGNLYSVLGVGIKASPDVIRSQYLKLARLWHPDRHQGSEVAKRKFQEIVSAFEVLSDDRQRAAYDLGLLDLLDVEDYLQRFQGLILTACGLGMASGTECPEETHLHHQLHIQSIKVSKRWLLTA